MFPPVKYELRKRVDRLLAITGNNFFEITEPTGGWPKSYKFKVMNPNDDEFGRFYLKLDAEIDYMCKHSTIMNLQGYDASLLALGVGQLEQKCIEILEKKCQYRSFPGLHRLLLKYYDLPSKT